MEKYNLKYTGNEIDELLENASSLSGIIVMWSGAIDKIPTGWLLCDGTNGTPDLRNRFIVGAGTDYSVGNTGGSADVKLTTAQMPSHTHTISDSGAHSHKLYYHYNIASWESHSYHDALTTYNGDAELKGSEGYTKEQTGYINTNRSEPDGAHTHTPGNTGSGQAHENRPPYYALAYIMKI